MTALLKKQSAQIRMLVLLLFMPTLLFSHTVLWMSNSDITTRKQSFLDEACFRDAHDYHCASHSVMPDSVTPWTVALQASLFMEFSRQEYWSGLPLWDLPDPGIEPGSPTLQADSLLSEPPGKIFRSLLFFPYKIYLLLEMFHFFKKGLFIHLPLAALGLRCCKQAFSSGDE